MENCDIMCATKDKSAKDADNAEYREWIRKMIADNKDVYMQFRPRPRRIVDKYDRSEVGKRLEGFATYSAAMGVTPTISVILDWLYGEREVDENDYFVSIGRLMEMVKKGEATPQLITRVLEYAKGIEDAAFAVYEQLHFLSGELKSVARLKEAFSKRFEALESTDDHRSSTTETEGEAAK